MTLLFVFISLLVGGLWGHEAPLQLVRPNADHSGFEVVPETLAKLAAGGKGGRKIALVSVVGPYHSGKSFLLNALIGKTDVFAIGPKTSPETMGLWLCRSDLTLPSHKDVEVWFIDSEGFFGPQVDESYDAKTFTLAMMLGDEFVYNTVKIIDSQAVSMLETLARRAQLFRVKSLASNEGGVLSKLQSVPHLTWVVEDFVQAIDDGFDSSHEQLTTRWLDTYLSGDVPYLKKVFPTLSVKALFLPATTREALSDLSKVPFSELTAEFRSDLKSLRLSILERLDRKTIFLSVSEFSKTLYFLSKALDKGSFPELPSLWHSWQSEVVNSSLQDAYSSFDKAMNRASSSVVGGLLLSSADFNLVSAQARDSSLLLYSELVKDFLENKGEKELSSLLASLDEQLKTRHHRAYLEYSENVWKTIEENQIKSFASFLSSVPSVLEKEIMEPMVLQAKLGELALGKVSEFGNVMDKFTTASGQNSLSFPVGWDVAAFPVFKIDPLDGLRIDLQTQIDSILLENDKSISNLIKSSSFAAVASVDDRLSSAIGKLFSTSELHLFAQQLVQSALSVYDSQLGRAWMKHISPQYEEGVKGITSLVQAKADKFKIAHQDQLFDFFRKTSEKALTVYKDLKKNIEVSKLPCEEELLEAQHTKAVSALIHSLDVELGASKFNDTRAYLETRARIDSLVDSELTKLRKKNIELWKVHSDEATHCASELNWQYTEGNCPQGWFCWFRIWPGAFKTRSKEHLLSCLGSSSLSWHMKDQVFESWFEKELAKDAGEVRNNMWVAIVSLLVPIAWIVYIKRC